MTGSDHIYNQTFFFIDFKYWEDGSDEFKPLEGSLLPLWKFHHDRSRSLIVSCLDWSPIYPDLFAVAYTPGEINMLITGRAPNWNSIYSLFHLFQLSSCQSTIAYIINMLITGNYR